MILTLDYAATDEQPHTPDFAALKRAGFGVAIFRRSVCYRDAAHGAYRLAPDPTFARDAQAARDAGLVVGAYLFPSFDAGAPSPAEQVANFFAAGGSLGPRDLPPLLDLEFPGRGVADTGHLPQECALLLGQLVVELARQGDCLPGVYTSHVQIHDDNGLGGMIGKLLDPAGVAGVWKTAKTPDDFDAGLRGLALLRDCLLWQKVPYYHRAGHPLDAATFARPHDGGVPHDPGDMCRTPEPWEGASGALLVQAQGDARGLPGGLRQADAGYAVLLRLGDRHGAVRWLRRLVAQPSTAPAADVYDAALADAVRAAQVESGLTPDGIVGPATVAALARGLPATSAAPRAS